jgi:hypothetical protein
MKINVWQKQAEHEWVACCPDELEAIMKCPKDGTKITAKHYDAAYEWWECPKCEGCFTADELEEAENGTSPRKRRVQNDKIQTRRALASAKGKVVAKGKVRQAEIADDEDAAQKMIEEMVVSRKSAEKEVKHRDEVSTGQIKNIMGDEIEAIGEETGIQIDRTNAVEYFAHNLMLALRVKNGISIRDKEVPMVKCAEHE